ncbi:MAG TPA: YqeG family HAD IIIA-type phosphatase [Chroococcidiopsis sp.]
MSWGKLLQPDLVLGGSILSLSPATLHHHAIRGVVLDVDETLVPTSTGAVSPELEQWVTQLKGDIPVWLVSNNLSQNRIGRIAKILDLPYILGARKPSRRKLRQAVEAMNMPPEEVAMVGDRLFTDVLAGNRLGMFTVLVEPMVDPAKETRHYYVRNCEVWISQRLGATLTANNKK